MDLVGRYWKAVVGFVAPGAGMLIIAVQPNSDGGSGITAAEWIIAGCTCVVTAAGVALAPYRAKGE